MSTSSDPSSKKTPLCYVVDEDTTVRHFISTIVQGAEIDAQGFAGGDDFRAAIADSSRLPNIVFFDVPLQNAEVMESMIALGERRCRGSVQLMSTRGAAVMENTKRIGEQNKLTMLPVLKKPFEVAAIQKILHDVKIGTLSPVAARVGLHDALEQNWIEFWYQPKIDLRKREIIGVEAVARARHPQYGVLSPAAFMPGADGASLAGISEMALTAAIKAGSHFAALGVQLTVSLNISLDALAALPVGDIVDAHRRELGHWPGVIVALSEKQIVDDMALAGRVAKKLEDAGVKFSIDGVGRGFSKLSQLKGLPIAELKLERAVVTDCGVDKGNAATCKSIIELAHNFGADAVAGGIEKVADLLALFEMGCDYGQGGLFAHPMSRQRLTAVLAQRAPAGWIEQTGLARAS